MEISDWKLVSMDHGNKRNGLFQGLDFDFDLGLEGLEDLEEEENVGESGDRGVFGDAGELRGGRGAVLGQPYDSIM
jgi:hypothetical protein